MVSVRVGTSACPGRSYWMGSNGSELAKAVNTNRVILQQLRRQPDEASKDWSRLRAGLQTLPDPSRANEIMMQHKFRPVPTVLLIYDRCLRKRRRVEQIMTWPLVPSILEEWSLCLFQLRKRRSDSGELGKCRSLIFIYEIGSQLTSRISDFQAQRIPQGLSKRLVNGAGE